ncbi:MAG: anti-sigma factor [Pyrinomonadaceae bacterium]
MKCSDLQSNLSLYSDGSLGESEDLSLRGHLDVCPLCRQSYAEFREVQVLLHRMSRPQIPPELNDAIKRSVRSELRTGSAPLSADVREFLQMRIMPYGIGVLASVLIGISFLAMMFSGLRDGPGIRAESIRGEPSVMLASNRNPFRSDTAEISPLDFAHTRLGLAGESPSVNPQGALIALTRSLVRGGMKDDEVVVVADVFGNGLAQIAEVVEPSKDRRAVRELQKALESDPAYAAFVPSTMENRPESVRVVLKFQRVDVNTGLASSRLQD